jgi:uncharacterized membrane protein
MADKKKKDDYDELTEEQRLRRRIEKRLEQKREALTGLLVHTVIFVFVNSWLFGLGGWVDNMANGVYGWPHIVTIFWGMGYIANVLDYYFNHGYGHTRFERQVDREVERERRKIYGDEYYEKVKQGDEHDATYRLSDDGELIEDDDEEYYQRGR